MKNLLTLFLFCLSVFCLTSCLDDDKPIYYYANEPAIVISENGQYFLETAGNIFSAPGLSDTLKAGDCLWTFFTVDMNNQPDSKYPQVTNLSYQKLENSIVRGVSGDMQDDYNNYIYMAALYKSYIDSTLFFDFLQNESVSFCETTDGLKSTDVMPLMPYGNAYTYEILYNTDSTILVNGIAVPKLYIKSKKIAEYSNQFAPSRCRFAFNMAEFVSKYVNPTTKTVPLYLHYKINTLESGDIYMTFQNYPIKWKP